MGGKGLLKPTVGKLAGSIPEWKCQHSTNPKEEGGNLGGARNTRSEKQCGLIFYQPAYKVNQVWLNSKQGSLMHKTINKGTTCRRATQTQAFYIHQLAAMQQKPQGESLNVVELVTDFP